MRKSIVWQMCTAIALAALTCMAIAWLVFFRLEAKTAESDFIDDTSTLATIVIRLAATDSLSAEVLKGINVSNVHHVKLLHEADITKLLDQQQVIYSDASVTVTDLNQALTAIYPIASDISKTGTAQYVAVSDPTPDNISQIKALTLKADREISHKISDRRFFIAKLLATLLLPAIVITLLWQINRINRYMKSFIDAGNALSRGDTTPPLDCNMPAPFGELAGRYNDMITDMEKHHSEQLTFYNAVSHELRTPLSKVHLSLELLKREHPEYNDSVTINDMANYIDEIDSITDSVLLLARLQDSRISTPTDTLERVDLSDVLTQRVNELSRIHKSRKISISISVNNAIAAINPSHFTMLIDNILTNALKYSENQVHVSLGRREDRYVIAVADDGPGIDSEKRQRVLKPFHRLDESRNRGTGGYGLGLAIVAAICERYGASLSLNDSPGPGGLEVKVMIKQKP